MNLCISLYSYHKIKPAMSKSIIITGATGNLGSAVTKRLLADGYKLYTTLLPTEKIPDDPHIHGMHTDLQSEAECGRYVDEVVHRGADLRAGILLVGGFQMGGLADTTVEDIDKMIRLNFYTAFPMVKTLFAHFEQVGGGQIILVGARPALQAADGQGVMAYALSKSLIFQLAEMINQAGKGKNISATVIVPSTIDTAINRKSMPDADFATWVRADDIADIISLLLTESGQTVRETVVKVYNNA
jgi:NAD(P)-dependent dehydrogenase (short-subunit alcohol dehydrogenase family)